MAAEKLEKTKPFLDVLQGREPEHLPFWFMRQAGRYLPEYRELRAEKGGFLAMAFDPKAACEITMQPLRRFGMDAAIIFSDILTIPMALGQHLEFAAGEGPKLGPLDLASLDYNQTKLEPVFEAIQNTRTAIQVEGFDRTALIGFAGAPWTVATYMVEGGGSKDFKNTKLMAYAEPEKFSALIDLLVESTISYLSAQIEAGAQAVQIFDSWSGALDPDGFEKWCIQPIKKITDQIHVKHPDVPVIGFPKGAGVNAKRFAQETGVDALGIDQHMPTDFVAQELQPILPVQGNLDPFVLMAGGEALDRAARKIIDDLSGGSFVFNLGHGIHKDTPVDHVEQMVKIVRGK